MITDSDRLYELVPVVYRMRDADQGYPLRALLRVISEQVGVVEHDIARLYENWFIETCDEWVIPYIGALIGYMPLSTVSRRDVANAIRSRRRKGTLSVLEDLAAAIAGRPALAVEFYRLLAVTQHIDHLQMDRGRTAELRDGDALLELGTAFDEIARNADVRRLSSARTQGRWNIPSVGVFLWRLGTYTVTRAPAYNYDEEPLNNYLFSALGHDTQLFVNPRAAGADPKVPRPIGRRTFDPRDYGEGRSIMIWTAAPATPGTPLQLEPVAASRIVPADLRDWTYEPTGDQVAVDPVLGRIAIPPLQGRAPSVWVSYSYGFAADIGGGEYERALDQPPDATFYRVGIGADFERIGDALKTWAAEARANAVIEIVDSGVYAEPVDVQLPAGHTLQLRAANGTRPVIRLLNWQTSAPSAMSISGAAESWFVLDGIVVSGREMQISGEISGVTIRHSTLVPGWGLTATCEPRRPADPSIDVIGDPLCLTIDHSIVGAIRVKRDEVKRNPLRLHIADSIFDATSPDRIALGAIGLRCADAVLTLRRSTVIGQLQTRAIELAENSILLGNVHACRTQWGCIRFCYAAPGSQTPRRYECQPDLVETAVTATFAAETPDAGDVAERDAVLDAERLRVEPEFESTRYGTPGYCRLAAGCAPEIATGAEDGSEMGVFHHLHEAQRAADLRRRLDEHTPAGTDAGIIYAS